MADDEGEMEPVVDPAKLRMESIGVAAEIIDEVHTTFRVFGLILMPYV